MLRDEQHYSKGLSITLRRTPPADFALEVK
jgi:hypothetical protein